MKWDDFCLNKNSDDISLHKEFLGGMIPSQGSSQAAERAHQRAMNLAAEMDSIPTLTPQNVEAITQAAAYQAQRNVEANDRRQAAKALLQLRQGKPAVSHGARTMRTYQPGSYGF